MSLDLSNASGSIDGFDGLANYMWTIATADSLASFDPDHIEIDASDFHARNATVGGIFSVIQSGNHINLNYTAIPEPATYAIGAGLCVLLAAAVRRRRGRQR